ncbi:ArsR family transcriptional regulator [Thermodesulfitimonas autotrophica]|uniref:ArsR family transcriptional regulator n=1 Tax=Thermodesulfitimonas autotrophica TaxID=1894989 RepID=A0A3N5BF79_9THEO|nr:autorepressor SdpR family transcription factor [Thermodesulfitimonas autotrophica]RPF42701.1 ArsR family transcriptional regulator [Thermodesulfitimonas autotrophica]
MALGLVFKALADETRREILRLLQQGDLTAGEIAARFAVTKPTVSHHLSVLKQANLVQDYRRGQHIYYSLNTTVFQEAAAWFLSLLAESARKEPGGAPGKEQTGRIKRGGGKACRKKIKAKAMPSPGRP